MKSKERVFFDSNVFLYHLGGVMDRATELLEMVEDGEVTGYINDVVISEVIYGYLRAVTGFKPYELRKKITKIDLNLDPVYDLLDLFHVLPLNVGLKILEIIEDYKLLPNDAIIAASCKYFGIKKIATFDDDFKRVDFLEIFR